MRMRSGIGEGGVGGAVLMVLWWQLGRAASELGEEARRVLDSCPSGFESSPLSLCDGRGLLQPQPPRLAALGRQVQAVNAKRNCSARLLFVVDEEGGEEDEKLLGDLVTELEAHPPLNGAPCQQVSALLLTRTSPKATLLAAERWTDRRTTCHNVPSSLSDAVADIGSSDFWERLEAAVEWLLHAEHSICQPNMDALQQRKNGETWFGLDDIPTVFDQHTKELIAGAILTALGICGACMCGVCALLLSRGTDVFYRRRETAATKTPAAPAAVSSRYSAPAPGDEPHCTVLLEPPTTEPDYSPSPQPTPTAVDVSHPQALLLPSSQKPQRPASYS